MAAATSLATEAPAPRTVYGSSSLTLRITASTSGVVVVGPSAVLVYTELQPDYHVPADHHDPIAMGTEAVLVLAVLFVGGKIVGRRLLPLGR